MSKDNKDIPQAPPEEQKTKFGELRSRYEKVLPHIRRALHGVTNPKERKLKRNSAFIAADSLMQEVAPIIELSRIDKMTDLNNKDGFMEMYEVEVEKAKISGDRLTVLFMDLNKFKSVNDKLGHAFGDILISEIGNLIRQSIRPTDIAGRMLEETEEEKSEGYAGRFGGDEFTILLKNADAEVAKKFFERLSQKLPSIEHYRTLLENNINIGIACGASQVDLENPTDSLIEADRAMYQAKRIGKRRKNSNQIQIVEHPKMAA